MYNVCTCRPSENVHSASIFTGSSILEQEAGSPTPGSVAEHAMPPNQITGKLQYTYQ